LILLDFYKSNNFTPTTKSIKTQGPEEMQALEFYVNSVHWGKSGDEGDAKHPSLSMVGNSDDGMRYLIHLR